MSAFELSEKESNILSFSFYSSTAFTGNQFRMQFKAAAAITGSSRSRRIQTDFIHIQNWTLCTVCNVLAVLGAISLCNRRHVHVQGIAFIGHRSGHNKRNSIAAETGRQSLYRSPSSSSSLSSSTWSSSSSSSSTTDCTVDWDNHHDIWMKSKVT